MADTEVTWRRLTLGGSTGYIVQEITGWEDLPDITSYDEPRTRGHGDHVGDQFSRSRIVTVTGKVADLSNRDEMARALRAVSTVSSTVEDLAIDLLGVQLTAGARLIRRSVGVGMNYSVGEVPFALQWKCPDPLRYGPVQSASTGLPTSGGGLAYPLAYPLTYGTAGAPGQIVLTNDGSADAPIVFTVTPPAAGGFEISAAGQRLTYPVTTAETLTIDTGAGTVLAQGTADRRANLVNADWIQVPAGGSITVQFTSLGAYDGAASLTASWRSASW